MARKDELQPEAEGLPVVAEPKPVVAEKVKSVAVEEPDFNPYPAEGGTYELNLLTGERRSVPKTEKG